MLTQAEILSYWPRIQAYARAWSVRDHEDLAQDVMETLLQKRYLYTSIPGKPVECWVFRVAHNRFCSIVKKPDLLFGAQELTEFSQCSFGSALSAIALNEAVAKLRQTKDGCALLAFVVDGVTVGQSTKKACWKARQKLIKDEKSNDKWLQSL